MVGVCVHVLSFCMCVLLSFCMCVFHVRGVPVAVTKRGQWVRDRELIKDTFYHDWEKMQRILKAGYPRPVSLAMNDDVKVTTK
jgi:hypothetical protein